MVQPIAGNLKSAIKNIYVVSKRSFKGKFITPVKKEADDLLGVGTSVDCYENGVLMSSYGIVLAPEIEPSKQMEHKNESNSSIKKRSSFYC